MKRKITIEIISSLFIVLFLYAALSKLFDYEKFSIQIGQSPLLTGFGNTIPWLVILLEITVCIFLIWRKFRLAGFLGAFSLMVMFTAYVVAILNFSSFIPCSCGGVLEKLGWHEHLLFNSFFTLLSLLGVLLESQGYMDSRNCIGRKQLLIK
jgi:uncharacterized membrane protein YphA (DoxX/SURF4 family)